MGPALLTHKSVTCCVTDEVIPLVSQVLEFPHCMVGFQKSVGAKISNEI